MIYLDNAATSWPKPPQVCRQVRRALYTCGNPGRGSHDMALKAAQIIYDTREALCALLRADDPLRIVLCKNATEALNLAIKGTLSAGDHVVTTAMEHNSVLRPLHTLKEKGVIQLTVLPCPMGRAVTAAEVSNALRGNTRLVAINHVSNVTGQVQPIEDIARLTAARRNTLLLVDGSQSVGILPIDLSLTPIDLLAFPGHKALFGPQGTGALYIGSRANPTPLIEGGTGTSSSTLTQPEECPERYESGTLNTPSLAGLRAGVDYVSRNLERICEHEQLLAQYAAEYLGNIRGVRLYLPEPIRTGVLALSIEGVSSGDAVDALNSRFSIACRGGMHCAPLVHRSLNTEQSGLVRASFSVMNTKRDADALICAIACIADMRR